MTKVSCDNVVLNKITYNISQLYENSFLTDSEEQWRAPCFSLQENPSRQITILCLFSTVSSNILNVTDKNNHTSTLCHGISLSKMRDKIVSKWFFLPNSKMLFHIWRQKHCHTCSKSIVNISTWYFQRQLKLHYIKFPTFLSKTIRPE